MRAKAFSSTGPALRGGARFLGVSLLSLLLAACSFKKSDHPAACRVHTDCDSKMCVRGFCVMAEEEDGAHGGSGTGGKNLKDGGASTHQDGGGVDAGHTAGEACDDGSDPVTCYDGPEGTADVGNCRSGQRACVGGKFTQCLGQALPGDEACNGKDDNCDGNIDEIEMADCSTAMSGICAAGALTCRGTFAVCEPVSQPATEECNGQDDDCDGKTDEMMSASCYPKDTPGCEAGPGGTYTCTGLCHAGVAACTKGSNLCMDAEAPHPEKCTTSGIAADENCNGMVDEGCACNNGDRMPCYSGPALTEGKGECKAGAQQCVNEMWGPCEGQVTPEPETCDNPGKNNDCDDQIDNIVGLGDTCIVPDTHGICLDGTMQCTASGGVPACVGASAMQELCDDVDQDCDGNPINGFDLTTDPDNCGKCENRCNRDEGCCEGGCRDLSKFQEDELNCGTCGNRCDSNAYCCQGKCTPAAPSSSGGHGGGTVIIDDSNLCLCQSGCAEEENCCGKSCVNLAKDPKNCGYCGHDCTLLGLLGSCTNGKCN
jgi:hypothetical protein